MFTFFQNITKPLRLIKLHKSFTGIIISLFITVFSYSQTTLYSYRDTTWDEATAWTTDPSGTLLTGSRIPINGDTLVILNGITIILDANVTTTNHVIDINSGGALDLSIYSFTNTIVKLSGQGKLRINSANAGTIYFPTVTTNEFITASGGTTEYYNITGTLSTSIASYNNLTLLKSDNNATSYTATLGSDLIIYGDLTLSRSQGSGNTILTIGNSTTARNLTVDSAVQNDAGCIINVGSFNAIHQITLKGNLTNSGSIDFSNSAQYAAANNGAATVTFSGTTNNAFFCEGQTDLYRMILNKGTDATYTLTVSSTGAAYFNLFGPVTATGGDWSTLALVIQNGTLKLMSQVTIPVLGKNTGAGTIREFNVPNTGCLWIDGATVSSSDAAGGWRGTTINGVFRISGGSFTNPVGTGGLTYFGANPIPGQVIIEGGTVYTTQFKQADVNGDISYIQTGGEFRITGSSDSRGSSAVFALPDPNFYFQMTGGYIYIAAVNTTATNGIDIRCSSSNYNVSGGSIEVVRPNNPDDENNFEIYSTVPFYNLTLKDTSLAGARTSFILQNALTVLNNLTVTSRTFNAANYNVTVGGNFNISNAGATYTPGTNRTTFNGSGSQTFTNNGTITTGLYRMAVQKSAGTLTLAGANLTVRDSLVITSGGTLADGGFTVTVAGNVYNAGTHSGAGKISLTTAAATQTISGDGLGVFGNLELNNTNASAYPVSIAAKTRVDGTLTLTADKIFNIANYNLILGPSATISGAMSATRFIASNGDLGDGGLTKYFSATSFTFPIGMIPTLVRYTPTTITFSSAPTYGSITVFPVDGEQAQTSSNGKNRSLTYYWRVRSSGFTLGSANVTQTFVYDQSDVVTGGGITEAQYAPARYDPPTYSWNKGTSANINTATNLISWPNNVAYIDGDYTAGDDNPQDPFGTVTVFYSYSSGNWRTNNVFMTDTTDDGTRTSTDPDQNTPVVIRNGHTITCDQNGNASGSMQIYGGGVLDCGTYTGLGFGAVVVSSSTGNGKIRISSGAATAVFPSGDFSGFIGSNGGTVEYYTPAGSSFTIPTAQPSTDPLTSYKNLILTPATGRTIRMPNQNMTIYGDMTSQGAGTGITYLNTAAARTLTINGNLNITSGSLQFDITNAQTLSVGGNAAVSSGATFNMINKGTAGVITNTLAVSGNLTNNGTLSFINGNNICNLTFTGSSNASITGTNAGAATTFNKVTVNKGSSQTTTLTCDILGTLTTLSDNWLTLQNGTLKFMRTGNFNISTTGSFTIPTTAGLHIENAGATAYIGNGASNTNDLLLNGKLTLVSGTINVGAAGNNNNNDIEYSASGSSEISISGGTLFVNGQIRRSTSGTAGVLVYNQTGGAVTINGRNQQATRAKLEVVNTGSVFNMSNGTITIVRGSGTTFGDLYLLPATTSVTGGTITFSQGALTSAETYIVNSTATLNHLTITGNTTAPGYNATVLLNVNPLSLNGNLTLTNANSILTANNLNVSLKGNFANTGTYTPGTNVTAFNGATQNLTGTTATTFYDLTVSSSTSLTLAQNFTANRNFSVTTGTLSNSTYTMTVKGNVSNSGIISGSAATGGLKLNGTVLQYIAGTGNYGRMELDNAASAKLSNAITLSQDLIFTNGNFDINQYLLTLGLNANLTPSGAGFSASKMIVCDGSDGTNSGVIKTIKTGGSTFTYPVGVSGKYTPVYFPIGSNATQGTILVKPINTYHTTISDPNNALHYYWHVESSGISNFSVYIDFFYNNADVFVQAPKTEANYYFGKLFNNTWSKWDSTYINTALDRARYICLSINDITGDYTCGTDQAIPSTVALYTSNGNGNWNNANIWWKEGEAAPGVNVPAGGPSGQNVLIRSQDIISITENYRNAYTTTINGRLNIGSTAGHNLGTVNGTGTLALSIATLPGGKYTDFFSCSGGTLEYGGSTNYTMSSVPTTIKKLVLTGTGNRYLPNKNITICDSLKIMGPTLNNSANNYNINISIGNSFKIFSGAFASGTAANATVTFNGTSPQVVGNFTGANSFNNITINNATGLTLDGPIDIKGIVYLTNGNITTTATNILTLTNTTCSCSPTGGKTTSFVDGPMTKKLNVAENFSFPVGDATRLGNTSVLNPETTILQWQAEFYYSDPTGSGMNSATVTAPITIVSTREYWRTKRMDGASGAANIKVRWDAASDINPSTTGDINNIRLVQWNASWQQAGSTVTGNATAGTVESTTKISLGEAYFTLGTTAASLSPTAAISGGGTYCSGASINPLRVDFTGTGPWTFEYAIGGITQAPPITTSDNPYSLAASGAGTYTMVSLTGGTVSGTAVITVNALPAVTASNNGPVCSGTTLSLTGGPAAMTTYTWSGPNSYASSQQSPVVSTSAATTMDGVYTLIVVNANGCTDSTTTTAVVNQSPSITVQPGNSSICFGANTSFTLTAIGLALTYQWEENQGSGWSALAEVAPYSNVTTATLNITAPPLTMNGYQYRCVVSGSCTPGATSNAVILTILNLNTPVFTSGAVSSRCQGAGTVTYAATVSGQVSGQDISFINLTNVTASGHDLVKTTATTGVWDAGAGSTNKINDNSYAYTIASETNTYRMFGLSNTDPNVNYTSIQYAVCFVNDGTLQIYESGVSKGAVGGYATGDTIKVSIESGVVKYYKNSTLLYTSLTPPPSLPLMLDISIYTINGTLKNIQTNSVYNYTLDAASLGGGNSIAATTGAVTYAAGWSGTSTITASATAVCGGTKTADHTVTINAIPSVTADPGNATICAGANTSFSVTASGSGLTYQWQENQGSGWNDLANGGVYSTVATAILNLTAVPVGMSTYQYRCVVSGTCTPADTSAAATLTVNTAPSVTGDPANSNLCEGSNTSFSVTATGTALTYQWEEDQGSGWNPLATGGVYSNVATATLNLTGITLGMDTYQYRCVVSGTCAPAATSAAAILTVYPLPGTQLIQHLQNNY